MISNPLRPLLRSYLGWLTKLALAKHKPIVIAIRGDGPNSLLRELIFQAMSLVQPVRRNLELPEIEFSIPLTVLGSEVYPQTIWQWLLLITRLTVSLFRNPPYLHYLVLEIDVINSEISDYWLAILNPNYIVNSSDFKQSSLENLIDYAAEFSAQFGLEAEISRQVLEDFEFPSARLQVYRSVTGSVVIDATHYYYPLSLKAVLELAVNLGERGILFSEMQVDSHSHQFLAEINPEGYNPLDGDVIILRGYKPRVLEKYSKLLSFKLN